MKRIHLIPMALVLSFTVYAQDKDPDIIKGHNIRYEWQGNETGEG